MALVRITTPENRLEAIVGGACDPTVEALARRADERVATLRDEIREEVDAMRLRIARLADRPEEEVFADCEEIGALALAICEIAGAAEMKPTGEAARGIHAMIQGLFTAGIWHTEALRLHIDSLALLNSNPEPAPDDAAQILTRLRAMREWVGVVE